MKLQQFDVNSLRVGKPCPVPWESMTGDERVRKCDSCQLSIFNIESMSSDEVKQLVLQRNGRLCIRLYRRADGTVATKDCPVGLVQHRKRIGRYAGAALGTILGLFSISYGQKKDTAVVDATKSSRVFSKVAKTAGEGSIKGLLIDSAGAVISHSSILLFEGKVKKPLKKTVSDEEGEFDFADLIPGTYRIEIPKANGFDKFIVQNVVIGEHDEKTISLVLQPDRAHSVVGILAEEQMIDMSVAGPTPTKITREMIDRIPGGKPF